MTRHFKYDTGYINIDETNIYFTTSGNWKEVAKLNEKSEGKSMRDNFKRVRVIFLIGLLTLAFLFGLYMVLNSTKLGFGIMGAPVGIYFLYKYFKPDLGQRFYIPLNKILHYNFKENEEEVTISMTIRFLNKEGKEDIVVLEEIERRGREGISELLGEIPAP